MLVKIKIKDIIAETDKAICFLVSENEEWFPKSKINRMVGNIVVVPEKLVFERLTLIQEPYNLECML